MNWMALGPGEVALAWAALAGVALWLYLHQGDANTGAHIAFRAPDHAAIGKFHSEGVKAGGRDNGEPGPRKDYSPTYFAAFLIDPDGNNVEAVCT